MPTPQQRLLLLVYLLPALFFGYRSWTASLQSLLLTETAVPSAEADTAFLTNPHDGRRFDNDAKDDNDDHRSPSADDEAPKRQSTTRNQDGDDKTIDVVQPWVPPNNSDSNLTAFFWQGKGGAKNNATAVGCCSIGGSKEEKDPCKQTCFTERACRDPLYPFASREEQQWFRPSFQSKRGCAVYRKRHPVLHPAPWCLTTRSNNATTDETVQLHSGCVYSPYAHMMLFPRHRLAVCGIPKVGTTQWLSFLRYTLGAADYQSVPYYKRDVRPFLLAHLPTAKQRHILFDDDNNWTKAVFLRHPAERLLSAYLDKGRRRKGITSSSSFADFVHHLHTTPESNCGGHAGPSWCTDPHWRPQYYFCGLHQLLSRFDFVGRMDHDQAANHTRTLLERVGLWHDYGAHYVRSASSQLNPARQCQARPPPDEKDDGVPLFRGFQQNPTTHGNNNNRSSVQRDRHAQNAKHQMAQHYTTSSEVRTLVEQLYAPDFALWNALTQQDGDTTTSWMTGSDLAARLNPQCR